MSRALPLKERFQFSRFTRGENKVTFPVTLSHRRIFILPVKKGLGFVLLIFLLLLIAFIYHNNLSYLLAFLLASIFFVSILHSYRSISGIVLNPGKAEPVFAGETAVFHVHLANPQKHNKASIFLKPETGMVQHTSLAAHSKVTVQLPIPTHKRGWQTIDSITIFSFYPTGLFRAWSPIRFNQAILVYPEPSLIDYPTPSTDFSAEQNGSNNTSGDDFYGLQEYQAGEAIRNIHWKAYAKGQGLFSKQYRGGSSREIWFDYAQTPGHNLEERLSLLCRWVIDAEQSGLLYGFKLPGFDLSPAKGKGHLNKCLKAMALFGL